MPCTYSGMDSTISPCPFSIRNTISPQPPSGSKLVHLPQFIEQTRKLIGKHSRSIGKDSRSTGKGSRSIDKDSKSIGKGSRSIGKDSRSIGKDSKSIDKDSRSIGKGSRSIGKDSRSIDKAPRSIGKDSRSIAKMPQNSSKEPHTIDKEPRSFVKLFQKNKIGLIQSFAHHFFNRTKAVLCQFNGIFCSNPLHLRNTLFRLRDKLRSIRAFH